MDIEDVKIKIKRKNKILFNYQSACLQELLNIFNSYDRKTIVLWAFTCSKDIVNYLENKYANHLFCDAYDMAYRFACGEIKLPIAKRYILAVHGFAKTIDDPYDIALIHALGQAISSPHVKNHGMGLVFYELTALVLHNGLNEDVLKQKICYYIDRMKDTAKIVDNYQWAKFLYQTKEENHGRNNV